MLNYVWPIALVILSNVFYQICAKSAPEGMHPLASLTVTYLVGGVISLSAESGYRTITTTIKDG